MPKPKPINNGGKEIPYTPPARDAPKKPLPGTANKGANYAPGSFMRKKHEVAEAILRRKYRQPRHKAAGTYSEEDAMKIANIVAGMSYANNKNKKKKQKQNREE
jgi:hypothetical protein